MKCVYTYTHVHTLHILYTHIYMHRVYVHVYLYACVIQTHL